MTTALLRPEVNHGPREVERVAEEGGHGEGNCHHAALNVVVAEVLVDPEEEELVLSERVDRAEGRPEHQLRGPDGEATLEKVAWALLEGDADQGVDGGCVASAELDGPRFVGEVGSSRILEGDPDRTGGDEGLQGAKEVLEGVSISEILRRRGTSVDVLPRGQLDRGISCTCDQAEGDPND